MNVTRRTLLGGTAAAGTLGLLARSDPAQAITGPAIAPTMGHSGAPTDAASEPFSRSPVRPGQVQAFPLTAVRLLPGPWKDMAELNRSYLYSLPNDRLAHNFRLTAGLPSAAEPLGGWEAPDCELRGHYVGHYLSACALLHAGTGDAFIVDKAGALVAILAECQSPDGYLGAYPRSWYERLRQHTKVWAPFYTYHKIVAGLLDMYEHTGSKPALSVAVRMADWADSYSRSFSPEDWQRVLLVEHGGMMDAAFNLYAITGEEKYRELAYRFEHKIIFEPLAANIDRLAGNHANTNIPKIIGAARGHELLGDERYGRVAENFHRIVTEHHAFCTGGTSNGEDWQAADAIASQLGREAEECCCSYNMMKLTRQLYRQRPDPRFFDYYERVLFNVRRGTQDRNGMLMYYVPLQPGMYKTFGTPFKAFWCCTGTGSEEYAKLNDSIYYRNDDAVYVNLFVPSTLAWRERGLLLRQTTTFPAEERITLTFDSAPTRATALKVRVPYWATSGGTVQINGVAQAVELRPSSYVTLVAAWRAGDVVTVELPMSVHHSVAADDPRVFAALYGPLVLAVRLGTEELTTSMIYGGYAPQGNADSFPLPTAASAASTDWLERVEASPPYTLQFRSKGRGLNHQLVPLSEIVDERYSVYLRAEAAV